MFGRVGSSQVNNVLRWKRARESNCRAYFLAICKLGLSQR